MESPREGTSAKVQAARHTLGLGLIFITAAIWIVSSFLSGSLVSSSDTKDAAVHPFLLTYLATSLFTLYLPLLQLRTWAIEALEAYQRRKHVDRAAYDALQEVPGARVSAHGDDSSTARTFMRSKDHAASVPMRAAAWVSGHACLQGPLPCS